jgi:hypothetical protein
MRKALAASTFAALTVALAAFTGAALAGNGHGNDGGGWSSDRQAGQAEQPQPASQPQQPASAPQQEQQPASQGWSKQDAKQSSGDGRHDDRQAPAGQPAPAAGDSQGVKPASDTRKDTHERADSGKTKRYGNGQTAGEIATARGAAGSTVLHGPGNSQPHKVLACGGKHEVDVHALKSASRAACAGEVKAATFEKKAKGEGSHKTDEAPAAATATVCAKTVTVAVPSGVWHRSGSRYVRGEGERGDDELVVSAPTSQTVVVADACKRSVESVRATAFQLAVEHCGHKRTAAVAAARIAQTQQQNPCTKTVTVTVPAGIWHRTGSDSNAYVRVGAAERSAHWTKHDDDLVVAQPTTQTVVLDDACGKSSEQLEAAALQRAVVKCGERVPAVTPAIAQAPAAAPAPAETPAAPVAPAVQGEAPAAVVPQAGTPAAAAIAPAAGGVAAATASETPTSTPETAAPATAAPATAASAPGRGGVLGAQATIAPKAIAPNAQSNGVLGTTARVASKQLPFTGVALWIFVLGAAVLLTAGFTLRRSARGSL